MSALPPTSSRAAPEDIARRRKLLGLTQQQLADIMGTNVTTIYRWEAGSVAPSLAHAEILREVISGFKAEISPLDELLLEQPAAIAVFDLQGIYLGSNRLFAERIGRHIDDVVGQPVEELFPELKRAIERKHEESFGLAVRRRHELHKLTAPFPSDPTKFISHRLDLIAQQGYRSRYLHEITLGDISGGGRSLRPQTGT